MGKKLEELLEFSEGVGVASIDTECLQRAVAEVRQELAEEKAREMVVSVDQGFYGRTARNEPSWFPSGHYAIRRLPDPMPAMNPLAYLLHDCWAYRCPACGAYTISGLMYPPECERCHKPWGDPIRREARR